LNDKGLSEFSLDFPFSISHFSFAIALIRLARGCHFRFHKRRRIVAVNGK